MPRPFMLAGLLGAAVGTPYVLEHADEWKSAWPGQSATATATEPAPISQNPLIFQAPGIPQPQGPGAELYRSPAPLEGMPVYSLAEVLRMDISKEWVYQRWARKSTGLADPQLFGVRVPLVSGTRMTDIAGSLTYYFNAAGQVDRITLIGQTADTRGLVNFLIRHYRFEPQTPRVAGEQLFQMKYQGLVVSELRTYPKPVLWATSPHNSFSIDLELNRPGTNRYVTHRPKPLAGVAPPERSAQEKLFGTEPAGQPVFPAEGVVPSTDAAQAEAKAEKKSEEQAPTLKKVKAPVLRWPG